MAKTTVKRTDVLDYEFPDGTKFTGTFENLQKVATALGVKITFSGKVPRGYYMSESKGLVKISSMNDYHLRRALLKRAKDYYSEVYKKDDSNREFLRKFVSMTEDSAVNDLYSELSRRD